jgi:hypothetical protein
MTSRGFRTQWLRARRAYRNASGGLKTAARKRLVKLVADELRREVGRAS